MIVGAGSTISRNEQLTFRANMGVGRHGWLRLTPAYGVRLVRSRLECLPPNCVVTDPFSGTGTTPLAAAELGHIGQSIDVNPFLVWLGNVKTAHYTDAVLDATIEAQRNIISQARRYPHENELWQPNLFKIEKWWSPGALHAMKVLRYLIDVYEGQTRNLLDVAFCRTLIACSNAAFNHQSMSFKGSTAETALFDFDEAELAFARYENEVSQLVESARFDLSGKASVCEGDSRDVIKNLQPADFVLTSPPYVNRMSYIRELRPYMYWLRYLDQASDAGNLDWQAIGGTWGTATSKLNSWKPTEPTPIDDTLGAVTGMILRDGGKNGSLLANYVTKYHHDMWLHFKSITKHVKPGGQVSYIIGNSMFYGHEIPAQEWYAVMLHALGYQSVQIEVIRKRNSNKALFEYEVSGVKPS